jgi:hypothetical protein
MKFIFIFKNFFNIFVKYLFFSFHTLDKIIKRIKWVIKYKGNKWKKIQRFGNKKGLCWKYLSKLLKKLNWNTNNVFIYEIICFYNKGIITKPAFELQKRIRIK